MKGNLFFRRKMPCASIGVRSLNKVDIFGLILEEELPGFADWGQVREEECGRLCQVVC